MDAAENLPCPLVSELTGAQAPTAAAFIVTIYGDAVLPRGEVLWIGSLIEICARVGFTENLVRTAVSRLVSAGRLQGQRLGKRSFYRLTAPARAEFAKAAQRLYQPGVQPKGWLLVAASDLQEDVIRQFHMARLAGETWLLPDWEGVPPGAGLILRSDGNHADSQPGLAQYWDLAGLNTRYQALISRFGPLARRISEGEALPAATALTARLLLVQAYRGAILRDPILPRDGLPADWAGHIAQNLFCQLYLALSEAAESAIAGVMEDQTGPLPARTDASDARLRDLRNAI